MLGALALFVLGSPATLQVADTRSGKAEIVARDIGRSIQRIPGGGISFVARQPADSGKPPVLVISEFTPATEAVTSLVSAPGAEADVAWTPDGRLLLASGDTLFGWRRGERAMRVVADLSAIGLSGATRLAVSPAGDRIAVVARPR